ncbi:MAG: peptidoglycan-binding domain-containing protein [Propylenella sp.]
MAAAIAANALFLQQRPHPAPLVATREAAVELSVQRSDDLVLAVQSTLRRIGYYSGPLDGVAGPQTEAAILAFEAAAGRRQTGEASLEILKALRAASASDATSLVELAEGGEAEAPAPDARVAAVQRALSIAAYGPLLADGVFGPQTRDAIVRFQQDRGLPPTGEISDALIVEMRAAGALQEE